MASKNPITVLQELAVRASTTPEYECVSQTGPQHMSLFEFQCAAFGLRSSGIANSKKAAKQAAAHAMLVEMSRAGHRVPVPFCLPRAPEPAEAAAAPKPAVDPEKIRTANTYVALLKEYCLEYRLPAPEDSLIGDSGPPHNRSFTVRVTVGAHSRDATAASKKMARQNASEAIYKYLRGCLRFTQDFVEKDALARSVLKKMNREVVPVPDNEPWRPSLDQKISEYQCGLLLQFNERERAAAVEALQTTAAATQPPSVQLECAAAALGIEPTWGTMPSTSGIPLVTVELADTSPSLFYIGRTRDGAAAHMVSYLNNLLMNPPRDPLLEFQQERERREREREIPIK